MSEAWHKYGQWVPYKNEKELRGAICSLNKYLQMMTRKFGKPRDLKWEIKDDKISWTAQFFSNGKKTEVERYLMQFLRRIYKPITQEMIDNGFLGEG
jgi:hypothetical protein